MIRLEDVKDTNINIELARLSIILRLHPPKNENITKFFQTTIFKNHTKPPKQVAKRPKNVKFESNASTSIILTRNQPRRALPSFNQETIA